ncbi:HxlR family transcriptional regulator [Klebsiella pneumoniae]|uniref:HxlR family transcriptional regulator n=1 Tax=Klebsiella pneumoniae TaxID=573 RepID=A0A4P0Y196_KLEPN|nr:HxlR family transcriptional regulator [Klebsiella pneumoniae]
MKRTRLENSCCPIARSLDVIGDWWSLLIVRDALRGVRRFSEFQKNLGIAKNMLAGRLKMLVDEGILRLQPASDGSAWQEYVLTDKGRACRRCWSPSPSGQTTICSILTNRRPGSLTASSASPA